MNRSLLLNNPLTFVFISLFLYSSPVFAQLERETDEKQLIELKTKIESEYASAYQAHHGKLPQDLLDSKLISGRTSSSQFTKDLLSGDVLASAEQAHSGLLVMERALQTRDPAQLKEALPEVPTQFISLSPALLEYFTIVLDQNFSISEAREILKAMSEYGVSASPETQAFFLEQLWARRANLPKRMQAMTEELTSPPQDPTDYSVAVSFFNRTNGRSHPAVRVFLSDRSTKYHDFNASTLPEYEHLNAIASEASRDSSLANRLIQQIEKKPLTQENYDQWLESASQFIIRNAKNRLDYLDLMFAICKNLSVFGMRSPRSYKHLGLDLVLETSKYSNNLGISIEWQVSLINYATIQKGRISSEGGISHYDYQENLAEVASRIRTQAQARKIVDGVAWVVGNTISNHPFVDRERYKKSVKETRTYILNRMIESIETLEEARELFPLAPTIEPLLNAKRRLAEGADNATRIELMKTFMENPSPNYLDANESFILEQYHLLRDARPTEVIRILEAQPLSAKTLVGLYSQFIARNSHLEHPWGERETARVIEAFTHAEVKKGETLPLEIHVHAHVAGHRAASSSRTSGGRCSALFKPSRNALCKSKLSSPFR